MVAPALADAPKRFVRDTVRGQSAKPAGFFPVTKGMLRPVQRAGKALSMPRRSEFGAFLG
jgi:hypothetical protein